MKTFVVLCFLMVLVMASQAQSHKEATEMDEGEQAMAEAEMMDFGGETPAEDTPNFEKADLG